MNREKNNSETGRRLMRVAVTVDTKSTGWELLAPNFVNASNPKVGKCEIFLNPKESLDVDYWIVFANARPRDVMRCARENTLFIAGEPEEKKVYPRAFYRQFYRVVDTHRSSGHPRVILHAPCLSWHLGYDHNRQIFDFGYEQLMKMEYPNDIQNKVSVVCSDASFTTGQRERLVFLQAIKERLGDRIDHFGRGFLPVDDKLKAIYGYRAHLVMENCRVPHYWTEKISDAYLGWSFPLYIGCPNIGEYFPENSYKAMNIHDVDGSLKLIEELLSTPVNSDEKAALAEGRSAVLGKYNPWIVWARWAEEFYDSKAVPENLVIRSHKAFRPFPRGLLFRLRG